jgi:glutamate formiminotransferase/formiminotetrahydrofolate cyclodeaminase
MNMFDCLNTPIQRVFEFCRREAARFGVAVTGSQLVGPIKLESIVQSFIHSLSLEGFRDGQILETHLMER